MGETHFFGCVRLLSGNNTLVGVSKIVLRENWPIANRLNVWLCDPLTEYIGLKHTYLNS